MSYHNCKRTCTRKQPKSTVTCFPINAASPSSPSMHVYPAAVTIAVLSHAHKERDSRGQCQINASNTWSLAGTRPIPFPHPRVRENFLTRPRTRFLRPPHWLKRLGDQERCSKSGIALRAPTTIWLPKVLVRENELHVGVQSSTSEGWMVGKPRMVQILFYSIWAQ